MFLLGMMSAAANATATDPGVIDPGVILRGDGASEQVGPAFAGGFQTTNLDAFQCATNKADGSPTGDGSNTNCFQNVTGTFTELHLFLTPTNPLLSISCGDNSLDPFFQNCVVADKIMFNGISTTEITFSGLGSSDACGEGGCQGIQNSDHFLVGLVNMDGTPDTTDNATYSAVADLPATPEPASALLFLSGLGMIASFLKRRSNTVAI